MSFISNDLTARTYTPGYFLAEADCARETKQIAASGAATAGNGGKYVPMGTIYPANNSTAIGIVYEDVDVSTGNMPGSVVTKGVVYEDRLPVDLDTDAKTALQALGFTFKQSPSTTRP